MPILTNHVKWSYLYSVHASVVSSLIQYFTSGGGSRAWRGFFQPIFYDVDDGNILCQ